MYAVFKTVVARVVLTGSHTAAAGSDCFKSRFREGCAADLAPELCHVPQWDAACERHAAGPQERGDQSPRHRARQRREQLPVPPYLRQRLRTANADRTSVV